MDGGDLAELVGMGEQLFAVKLFLTAIHCLWIYDYLLTFGDEIKYAWNGRRSWVFALFIANRYSPVPHIIWSGATLYDYSEQFCERTKSLAIIHSTLITVLAEIMIALRIYAVTERNKWLATALAGLVAAQFVFGIYSIALAAVRPMQQLPGIDLDPFKFCLPESWKAGELLFINITVAFDILAFLSIVIAAAKPRNSRFPGIPSILDVILRDATVYFIIVFLLQILGDVLILSAPESVALFPALAGTILVPLMVSRLMLSLKKATVEPTEVWSLSTLASLSQGTTLSEGTVRFAPHVPGGSDDALGNPSSPSFVDDGVELEPIAPSTPNDRLRMLS